MRNFNSRHFARAAGVFAFSLAAVAAPVAKAAVVDVWAVNDGEKIKRDDITNANRSGNSVWNAQTNTVSLFGARNEVVAFQTIVASNTSGAVKVNVQLPQLVHSSGYKLTWAAPRADPTDTSGRQIERFTEHYLNVTQATPPGWFYYAPSAPQDMLGWVPDALVPFDAAAGKGGGPFDIQGQRNQGVWFDIYIPKNAPAGTYSGTITTTENNRIKKKMPISLRVYNFTLPDQAHLPIMIYAYEQGIPTRHGASGSDAVELLNRYHRLAKRHRIELVDAIAPPGTQSQVDRLSGTAFTSARGYDGPGQGVGNRIIPADFYGLSGDWAGPAEVAWPKADAFMNWINSTWPNSIRFLYLPDEPNTPAKIQAVKDAASMYKSNPGPGRALPMFDTTRPKPELEGLIDIWATVSNEVDLQQVAAEKAKGRRWWYYNGQRPQSGTNILDAPAVDTRVFAWACWKHDIELWFYWDAVHWRDNVVKPNRDINVWTDPTTIPVGTGRANGDGLLLYPGQDALFPAESRGIVGPIASIRLKNIRRGAQDYEYLWLATQHGLTTQARTIANTCVPKVFSEANVGGDMDWSPNPISWSVKGSDWDTQRKQLADLLEQNL